MKGVAIGTVKGKHVLKRKVLRTTGQKYKQWVLTPEAKRAKRAKAKARLAASLKDKRKPSAKRARGGGQSVLGRFMRKTPPAETPAARMKRAFETHLATKQFFVDGQK